MVIPGSRDWKRRQMLKGVWQENREILGLAPGARTVRRRLLVSAGLVSGLVMGMFLLLFSISRNSSVTRLPQDTKPAVQARTGEVRFLPPASPEAVAAAGEALAAGSPDDYLGLAKAEVVPVREVFGLGIKTIMIDPGHGGKATGAIGRHGLLEKDVTLDIALKLKALFERDTAYRILLSRDGDFDVPLRRRVELTNTQKCDLFISIHVNSLGPRPIDFIETFFFGPSRDKGILELAAAENEGSDYAISDYDRVIRGIANELKFQESSKLAQAVQDQLYRGMRRDNRPILDCGVKRAPFLLLLGVEMPGVLVEVASLSHPAEEEQLRDPAYRENIAGFIKLGITQYLDQRSGS